MVTNAMQGLTIKVHCCAVYIDRGAFFAGADVVPIHTRRMRRAQQRLTGDIVAAANTVVVVVAVVTDRGSGRDFVRYSTEDDEEGDDVQQA